MSLRNIKQIFDELEDTLNMAKVLISMREEFLDKIDEIAETEQRTRSELIRQALRVYMRRRSPNSSVIDSVLLD
jgi:CopG family transcriptional regulator/antitoxin EndoAI